MFSKSKIVAPLVALLVACMAVEAAPAALDLPITQQCACSTSFPQSAYTGPVPHDGGNAYFTQQVCTSLGSKGVFVDNGNNLGNACNTATQSGSAAFNAACIASSIVDNAGTAHFGVTDCINSFPTVPLPTSCFCEDTVGANATSTTTACNFVATNIKGATLVGNKCAITTDAAHTTFAILCTQNFGVGAAVCSSA
ncbi:hypothetical protein BGZ98_001268, partial [Dissophora globulifera]